MRLYQVFDLVSQGVVGPIIAERADGAAVRVFESALTDARTVIGQYPKDFVLMIVGEQDALGSIEACIPAQIISGVEVLAAQELAEVTGG